MSLNNPHIGESFKKAGAYFEPLIVRAQDVPNMTVKVAGGGFWVNDTTYIEFVGGNSPPIVAPITLARWTFVTLKQNGTIELVNGVASAAPVQPVIPTDGRLTLAAIFVNAGTTAITNAMISDNRPLFNVGNVPISHVSILGRIHSDAHDIGSITGLTLALADKVDFTTFNNSLVLKADIGGTPSSTFILNNDEVGVPASNVSLVVERGSSSNVDIRWNESLDQWEFTNDGVIYNPVGTGVSNFYLKIESDGSPGTLGAKIDKITGATAGNFPTMVASGPDDGELVNSAFGPTSFIGAVGGTTINRIATWAAGDALQDSGVLISDVALTANHYTILQVDVLLDQKLDTIVPSIVGNFVGLDGLGHSFDSGFNGTSFVTVTGDTMTGPLVLPVGSAGVPSLTFTGDLDTGLFQLAADEVSVAIAGAEKIKFSSAGVTVFSSFIAGTPGVALESTLNPPGTTGVSFPVPGVMDIVVGGVPAMSFGPAPGSVSISMLSISADLDMNAFKIINLGTPIAATDAATKAYVDITGAALAAHIADDSLHLTPAQNTLLDGLAPSLTFAELNFVDGVTSPIQTQIDGKAPLAHTHLAADITDFNTAWTAEHNLASIDGLADVVIAGPVLGDFIRYNGVSWVNIALVKSHITDFVEADYVHIAGAEVVTGAKTFSAATIFSSDVSVGGNLTVSGTMTTVNSNNVNIGDNIITLNSDEAGAPSQNAGLEIERGTSTNVNLLWNEGNLRWEAEDALGVDLPLSRTGDMNYELQAGTGGAIYTTAFNFVTPAAGKASLMVFVNGLKQVEGAAKAYTITAPSTVTFTVGNEPAVADDVEFYGI